MGYDLKPMRPTKRALRKDNGDPVWGRYNMSGWRALKDFLANRGVDVSDMPDLNDGHLITSKKCKEIADVIEHFRDHLERDREWRWMLKDVEWWRNCGGCRIY